MRVAPCRVDVDERRRRHRLQERDAVAADDMGVVDAELMQIMRRERAQLRLPFDVDGLVEGARHEGEVDAEAAGEVDERRRMRLSDDEFGREPSLVFGRRLRRALFHRHMRRVDDAVGRRPARQFRACDASAGDLVERERHVHVAVAFRVERDVTYVLIPVRHDERTRRLIDPRRDVVVADSVVVAHTAHCSDASTAAAGSDGRHLARRILPSEELQTALHT